MAVAVSFISGIAYPEHLQFLNEIYDDMCFELGFHRGSPAAADLARATMDLFAQGLHDEIEIRESLELYLARKSVAGEFLCIEEA